MKKILLLFFIASLAYGQDYTGADLNNATKGWVKDIINDSLNTFISESDTTILPQNNRSSIKSMTITPKSNLGSNVDLNLVPKGNGMVGISGGWGLGFTPNDVVAGPDFGDSIGGMAYRNPAESMTKSFFLFRGGQYVFENDSADWQMIITPTGVNIGGGATSVGGAIPLSKFEVDGNATIGGSYDRVYSAPINGLLIQGQTVIGTTAPRGTNSKLTLSDNLSVYNGKIVIGQDDPELTLTAAANQTGSAPATSGTTQTGGVIRLKNTTSYSCLDVGVNGGNGSWLQSTNTSNLASSYPLTLNPNGGTVTTGAQLTVGSVLKLTPLSSAPTGSEGMIYANSTDHHLYFHNGTTWVQLDN